MSIINYPNGSNDANALVLTDNSTQLQETSGTATQSGVISESGGSFGVEKIGAGTLILTANNTYSGGTTISAGTLAIGNNAALGATTGALTLNGGTLQASNNLDLGTRSIVLGSSGGTIDNNTWGVTIGGVISGSGNLTSIGGYNLGLTGNNTYSGTTTISGIGSLQIGNGGTTGTLGTGAVTINSGARLRFNRSDTITVSNAISGAGDLDVAGSGPGAGTVILTGTNSYGRSDVENSATLQIGNGGTSGTLGTGVVNDAGTLSFDRSDTITVANLVQDQGISGALVQAGSGTTILTAANTYSGGTTISAGTLQIGSGSTSGSLGSGAVTDNSALVFNRSDTITVANAISGNGSVTFTNFGGITLTGNNSYSGGTTIYEGAILVGNGGTTGSITGNVVAGVATSNCGINFDRSDNITFGGNISGLGYLAQYGTGTLTLTGNNTYGAYTTIEQGTLAIGSASNLGSGAINLYGAGTLQFTASFSLAQNVSLEGGAIDTGSNNDILSGVLSTAQGANVQGGYGGFTKVGAGTLTLTGNNTYLGPTVISAGTLQIGNGGTSGSLGAGSVTDNAALVFDRSDNITVANTISGTGILTQAGSDVLTLTSADTYTGTTTISSGTLALAGSGGIAASGGVADNGAFDISQTGTGASITTLSGSGAVALGGRTLTITSGTGFKATSVLSGVIADGGIGGGTGGSLVISGGTEGLTGNNTYTGTTTIAAGATLVIGVNTATGSLGGGAVTDNGALAYERSAATTLASGIAGTGELDQYGTAALTLTGANLYTGRTLIYTATTLALSGTGSITASSYLGDAGGTFDISGTIAGASIKALTDLQPTGGGPPPAGGVIALGGKTLTITAGANYVFSGVIQDGGIAGGTGGGLTLAAGGQFLTGNNTYTGTTTIASGATLVVGNNTASGSLGSGNVVDSGTLDLDRSDTNTITNAISGTGVLNLISGTIALTGTNSYGQTNISAIGALNVGNGGTTGTLGTGAVNSLGGALTFNRTDSFTISNNISGSGNVFKVNTGTAILTGTNTYSGITIISGGVLVVGNGGTTGSLGSGSVSVNSGATLAINRSDTFTLSNAILSSTNGVLVQSGGGTTILTGANTYNGGTTISAGTLQVGNGGTVGTLGSGAIIDNASLVFDRSDTYTLINNSSGTGSLTQAGSGTLILNANNIYSGGTVINSGGTLQVGSGGTNGTLGGGTVTNNGILIYDLTSAATVSNVISGAGAYYQYGSGHIIFSGIDTYTGTTSVTAGILSVDGAIASSAVTVSSGATLGGTGTVGAASIQSGGTLAPGDGIGTLQVNGNLSLASGATDAEEISSSAADEILVSGTASIAGTLTENFSAGSYGHQTYTILHSTGALSGTFANVSVTGLPAGLTATLSYDANDVYLTTDHAPVVTTSNLAKPAGQTLAASSLFTVSDPDGDTITEYQFWDATPDANSGYFTVGGVVQAARTVIDIPASQLSQVSFVTGSTGDNLQVRAFDGTDWSAADNAQWAPFTISVPVNHPPVVTTSNISAQRGQTLAASSLFSVSDPDGDTITEYQFWDATPNVNSGHFVVNGTAQAARTVIDIPASQLSQVSFVTGTSVADNLQVRAFDGTAWSAADNAQWAPFTITVPADNPPVVTTGNLTEQAGQTLAASSLFTVSDPDGDTITEYQFWDATPDANSGYFTVGGVVQAARTVIDVSAAQLSQVSFVTGSVADNLQVRAFDGTDWSAADNAQWAPFTISVPVNHPPVVTTSNISAQRDQSLAASSLFTVSDPDGDTITEYQFWDATPSVNSGHFVVNGTAQAARTVIDIPASQLSQVSFVTGTSVADNLQVRAFDGTAWSAADSAQWAPFTVSVPADNPPVVTTGNLTEQAGQTLAASSLFTVSDPDGDTITEYQFWDATPDASSGYFTVGGVVQAARTVIDVSAAQLSQVSFVTGSTGDNLQVRAFDGTDWSAADNAQWAPFTISVPVNHPPVVTTSDISAQQGQTLAASSLFTVSDPDGDTITEYQFWDATPDATSGHFVVNGTAQAARTVIDIPASQLSQVSFLTGSTGDALQVRAFDGKAWSAADNAQWAPFHVAIN